MHTRGKIHPPLLPGQIYPSDWDLEQWAQPWRKDTSRYESCFHRITANIKEKQWDEKARWTAGQLEYMDYLCHFLPSGSERAWIYIFCCINVWDLGTCQEPLPTIEKKSPPPKKLFQNETNTNDYFLRCKLMFPLLDPKRRVECYTVQGISGKGVRQAGELTAARCQSKLIYLPPTVDLMFGKSVTLEQNTINLICFLFAALCFGGEARAAWQRRPHSCALVSPPALPPLA